MSNDPFLDQLVRLCALYPTRAKWVIAPSHAQGRTIGERLVREGTNWLNLRFVTPLDVALRMGAPFLVERGIDPSEEDLGPALMMRLLLDLPGQGGYFSPIAHHPTLAQAVWRTILELRMAGVAARDLPADAFASAEKHRELCAVLESYEHFLTAHARADMALVYEEALRHPDWCPIQPPDCWTELPDVVWSPLQRRLLEALPGERIVPRGVELPHGTRPRRMAARDVDRLDPDPRTNALAFLMDPARPGGAATRVELFHAGGREAEIEEVFRRILASGRSLDEVEIACASEDCSMLAWEKALRYDWPATIGPGVPAAQTRPGRAVLAFCGWIESDFAAGFMRRLLQSGDVRLQVEDLTAGQAAGLLFRAQAAWGRETYARSLQQLLNRYTRMAGDPDNSPEQREAAARKAARVERLREWLQTLLASIPPTDAHDTVSLEPIVASAIGFLDGCAARGSALDAAAAGALGDATRELLALGSFRCPLPAALRFIRERVETLFVASDRPRPGHLHVSTLSGAGYSGRPYLFVVGLDEGRVFPAAVEDPVLLDAERAAISPSLRRSADRTEESVYAVLARLAARGARDDLVSFSYSSRDTREYRETFPSWLMLQAYRLQSGNASGSYPDLHAALGTAVSAVPERAAAAASEAGWWLAQLKARGSQGARDVLRAFPALDAGRAAEAARDSATFTEFDGYVPEAGARLDPSATTSLMSATQLEHAAECPFRHFLQRGLGLQAVEDGERERDVWLDPLTRGAELHDLYAALLRRCRTEGRSAAVARDRDWFHEVARGRLHELRVEMPPPSEEVFSRETDDLLADLDLFLDAESRMDSGQTPIGFEVSFGQDVHGETEALTQPAPVVIPIGGGRTLRLRGRIDRIDRTRDGTFEIIDYKTGGYWESAWRGTFAGGTRLQHALYGIAAAELLKGGHGRVTVDGGVYYFTSVRGRQERVRIPRQSPAAVQAVLSDLREVIASGLFVHAPDENACRWCDLGAACGPGAHARAAGKRGDPRLAPFIRLQQHA